MRVLILCLIAAGPVTAQDAPTPDYFAGRYVMIGRDATGLVDEGLHMQVRGADLVIQSCKGVAGRLVLDRSGEGPFAALTLGEQTLACQWFNTWDNYPLLTCHDEAIARLTLWPMPGTAVCLGASAAP